MAHYKISFAEIVEDSPSRVNIAEFPDVETAVEFGLALHRSSNLPHEVEITLFPDVLPNPPQSVLVLSKKS